MVEEAYEVPPRVQALLEMYGRLSKPAVLPDGKPNVWLLELGIAPLDQAFQASLPSRKQGKQYRACTNFTLWDPDSHQPAAACDRHRMSSWGRLRLSRREAHPEEDRPRDLANINSPRGTEAWEDLCTAIVVAILSTFGKSLMKEVSNNFSGQPARGVEEVVHPHEKAAPETPLAPHTILVYDQTTARLLSYLFPYEGRLSATVLSPAPLFSFIPSLRLNERKNLAHPDGTYSQFMFICAYCLRVGVANSGTLDDDLDVHYAVPPGSKYIADSV